MNEQIADFYRFTLLESVEWASDERGFAAVATCAFQSYMVRIVAAQGNGEMNVTVDALDVARGTRAPMPIEAIGRVRIASNSNWAESRFLEDALTAYDPRGKKLLKVPTSAIGYDELLTAIQRNGANVEHVEVSAPSFLD